MSELYPFQIASVEKMLHFLQTNEAHACLQGSDLGLGKTLMSIECTKRIRCKRILVLCPAILRLNWVQELRKFDVHGKVNLYLNSTASHSFELFSAETSSNDSEWTICSYDLSYRPKVLQRLEEPFYDMVIYDEVAKLKSSKTKRTRAGYANLWSRAHFHILLSGCLFSTRIIDGFTAFHKCAPSLFPRFADFVGRYCYERRVPWGRGVEYFGLKNADELSRLIRGSFYIRYKKEEVLPDLPAKTFQRILLPSTYSISCNSKDEKVQLEFETEKIARAISTGVTPPIPKTLAEHRRLQALMKLEPVSEFILELLEQGTPLVVFGWHVALLEKLAETCKAYKPALITGKTPALERAEAIRRFQEGETDLFCGNYIACGIGVNLTRSSTVILAELDYSPANVRQSIDRTHRIGQQNAVLVYYFVIENSLDSVIENVVIQRAKMFDKVLDAA